MAFRLQGGAIPAAELPRLRLNHNGTHVLAQFLALIPASLVPLLVSIKNILSKNHLHKNLHVSPCL